MKKRTCKIYLLVLTLFNILISLAFFVESNSSISSEVEERSFNGLKLNAVHLPIIINGNSNFTLANGVSPGGDGSYDHPYLIEDLIIDTSGVDDCIFINNTNVYFKIQNCTLINSGSELTIRFNNVSNGKIWNNQISLASIFLIDSHKNSISNNTIFTNSGISLFNSNNNTIYNNTLNNCKEIYLGFSDDNEILNNYIKDSINIGISLISSCNNTIKANEIYDGNDYAIGIMSASNTTKIIDNYIFENDGKTGLDQILIHLDCVGSILDGNIYNYRDENGGDGPSPIPDLFWLYLIIIIGTVGAVAFTAGLLYRRYSRKKEHKHPEPGEQEPYKPEESSHQVNLPEPPDLNQDDLDSEPSEPT
ncbi:MAG: NosD domain-containing protein [Candidatus Thorarchaeota archaeon]